MQVPTHLVVHCSAFADLGCLIRSCFPSPPAHQNSSSATPTRKGFAKHICTHRTAWAGRWRRCPPGAPASTGWPREPAPPRPAPPAPTSPLGRVSASACVASGLGSRSGDGETVVAVAQDKSARTVASRTPGTELWPVATGQTPGSASLAADSPAGHQWASATGEEDTMGPHAPGLGWVFIGPALASHSGRGPRRTPTGAAHVAQDSPRRRRRVRATPRRPPRGRKSGRAPLPFCSGFTSSERRVKEQAVAVGRR